MSEWPPKRVSFESLTPEAITVPPEAASRFGWVWPALALCGFAGGGLFVLFFRAGDTESAPPAERGAELRFPATCGANQRLEIDGVTRSASGTLVTARANCTLSIRNSTLAADIPLVVEDGATIAIESSTLEGKIGGISAGSNVLIRASRTSIRGKAFAVRAASNLRLYGDELVLSGEQTALESQSSLRAEFRSSALQGEVSAARVGLNGQLEFSERSKLSAKGTALLGDANLSLRLSDSSIEGDERGIVADTNANLRLESGARVRGGRNAIIAGGNLALSLRRADIEASSIAVCSTLGADITADDSRIAAREVLRLEQAPKRLEVDSSLLAGSRVFDARNCDGASSPKSTGDGAGELFEQAAAEPPSKAAPGVPFNFAAATTQLDFAVRMASAACHARPGKSRMAVVIPGFTPDGANRWARLKNPEEVGTAADCVLEYFQRVRVPPFDPSEKPGEMFRVVGLKP